MATNPTSLLVDKPLSAPDKPLITTLRVNFVQLLAEQEVVTAQATHDPEETGDVSHLRLHLDGSSGT